MTNRVSHDPDEARYELFVDDEPAGLIEYRDGDGVRDMFHTEVSSSFQGRGLAAVLATAAVADVRAQGLMLVPTCPYILRYLRKHPEDLDLVPADSRERLGLS